MRGDGGGAYSPLLLSELDVRDGTGRLTMGEEKRCEMAAAAECQGEVL